MHGDRTFSLSNSEIALFPYQFKTYLCQSSITDNADNIITKVLKFNATSYNLYVTQINRRNRNCKCKYRKQTRNIPMFKPRTSLKGVILGFKNAVQTASQRNYGQELDIGKVLVVSKLSRFDFERKKHAHIGDVQFEEEMRGRGTDFEKLVHFHNKNKQFEENVIDVLEKRGISVEVVNRFNYTEDKVHWADVVMPIGGDGTFLLAASRVRNNLKPVVGFNSDPSRSEGHLCLPKQFSTKINDAIEMLQKGDFHWLMRSRIRIKLLNPKGEIVPRYLHEVDTNCEFLNPLSALDLKNNGKVLPVLALNEVFVGETMSARVSHLQMRLNGASEQTNMKCSGVCICTGTGSTSWHLSINRLPVQSVAELLRLVNIQSGEGKGDLAHAVAEEYNRNLVFAPNDKRMGYTIRDLISAGVWPQPKGIKSRGFASKIEMKSSCYDASLVVDGGVSFVFNDGTIAFLETLPEDALRTVVLHTT